MQTLTIDGLSYLAFEHMVGLLGLRHGISIRWQRAADYNAGSAGAFEFDFSSRAPDRLRANVKRFCDVLNLPSNNAVIASQVHSADVAVITEAGQVIPSVDALCTACTNIPLMLRGADCPLVLVYDPAVPAVGLAHAGWRGTVQQITVRLIETMTAQLDCRPERLFAGVGPGICGRCYQVGTEVVDTIRQKLTSSEQYLRPSQDHHQQIIPDKWQLDLHEANRQQLLGAGVPENHIETSPYCTFENPGLFPSYRRDKEFAGRWALMAGLG